MAAKEDLAYDVEDIIAKYALKLGSRKEEAYKRTTSWCACILGEGITVIQVFYLFIRIEGIQLNKCWVHPAMRTDKCNFYMIYYPLIY